MKIVIFSAKYYIFLYIEQLKQYNTWHSNSGASSIFLCHYYIVGQDIFPFNIIGRSLQEIYPRLKEKVGRMYPVPILGRNLEENILQ